MNQKSFRSLLKWGISVFLIFGLPLAESKASDFQETKRHAKQGRFVRFNPFPEDSHLFKCHELAQRGSGKSAYVVGKAFEEGVEVSANEEEALAWYKKAEKLGYKKAEKDINRISKKVNTPKHGEEAMRSQQVLQENKTPAVTSSASTHVDIVALRQMALNGSPEAAFKLGYIFQFQAELYGLMRDPQEALKYYQIAAVKGLRDGVLAYRQLSGNWNAYPQPGEFMQPQMPAPVYQTQNDSSWNCLSGFLVTLPLWIHVVAHVLSRR
jgi:TPR repeat protein